MRTFASISLSVLLVASALLGLIVWLSPINPGEAAFGWSIRIAAAVIFPASLIGLVVLASRPEKVPDFLAELPKPRMGRGGVLFVIDCAARDGWAWIDIHYQNRFANPAVVTVGFIPSQNFLMKRNEIDSVAVHSVCGPAAFGVVRVPIAIKQEYQGNSQSFDVASQADYPNGHGECLRNVVGPEISALGFSAFNSNAVTLAKIALTGHLKSIRWQSRVKLLLPQGVAEATSPEPKLVHEERWTLADSPATDKTAGRELRV